jgi:GAF domain-containing protein
MFGRALRNTQIPQSSYRHARDVVFLEMRNTVFCTSCELIFYNNASRCLACGSQAVLSLSRVLGGSMHGEECAHVVVPASVGEILPAHKEEARKPPATVSFPPQLGPEYAVAMQAQGAQAGIVKAEKPVSVLQFGVERACALTNASGGAVAMKEGNRMVCRANSGAPAPCLGATVPQEGITAMCARTGQMWRCNDSESEPWVNRDSCRSLGIRSIVVAPVLAMRRVLGILEVFSPKPAAFDDRHAATVQLMASAIAVASLRSPVPLRNDATITDSAF